MLPSASSRLCASLLVLFDIDGTLLRSEGAGMQAMLDAARELHPGVELSFANVPTSGRMDHLIWRDLMAQHSLPIDEIHHRSFRSTYHEKFQARLAAKNTVHALEGVAELIEVLQKSPGVTTGLLTGNYEHTGMLKIRSAGLDPARFKVNAWADDGATRRDLPPVALERYQRLFGRRLAPKDALIIGDTESDIDCARANGLRCLATATGIVSMKVLASLDPDKVVADLSQTSELVSWITQRT